MCLPISRDGRDAVLWLPRKEKGGLTSALEDKRIRAGRAFPVAQRTQLSFRVASVILLRCAGGHLSPDDTGFLPLQWSLPLRSTFGAHIFKLYLDSGEPRRTPPRLWPLSGFSWAAGGSLVWALCLTLGLTEFFKVGLQFFLEARCSPSRE